jgi:thiol-disulfide isomerase/thioredoxin
LTRRATLAAVTCIVAAAAGFGAYRFLNPDAGSPAPPAPSGEIRPDLEFRDAQGKAHRLSEWNGKLLLLNFWATWCAPCLKEIPLLVEAQQQHAARGLQIVGIAMDEKEPVLQMAQRLRVGYPIMVGSTEVMSAMDQLGDQLGALPFSVLIAPDGRVLARLSGALTPEELAQWLAHLPS